MELFVLILVVCGIYIAVKAYNQWLDSSIERHVAKEAEELKNKDYICTKLNFDIEVVVALSKLANNLDNGSQSSASAIIIDNSDPAGSFSIKAYLADYDGLLRLALMYKSEISDIHMDDSINDFKKQVEDYQQRIKHQEDCYRLTAFSGLTDSEFGWIKDAEFVVDHEIFTSGDGYRFEKSFGAPCKPYEKDGLVKLYVDTIHQRLPNADITSNRNLTIVTFKGSGKVVYKK